MVVDKVCAWHPQYFGVPLVMGQVEVVAVDSVLVTASHGICSACHVRVRAEFKQGEK